MSSKTSKTSKTATTNESASNAASAAKVAITAEERLEKVYGKRDMRFYGLHRNTGTKQEIAACMLHAICASMGKDINYARSILNTYTGCCYKRDGIPQKVGDNGGNKMYCEPCHYGFLYGTTTASKFYNLSGGEDKLNAITSALETEYGKAVVTALKADSDKVHALVDKLADSKRKYIAASLK